MFKKINEITIIVIFLIAVSLPLVFSDKEGGKRSPAENRVLAVFPQILTSEGKLAPGINNGIKNWISDNAGFRSQAQYLRAIADVQLFRISSNDSVHVGQNGWYYFTENHNLEIGKAEYFFTEGQLVDLLKNIERIQHFFNEHEIEFLLVLVPSKASVYPEFIYGGQYTVKDTLIDQTTDYIRENSSINILNLKDDLIKAKDTQTVFFKTDTHWNQDGEYIGYLVLIDELNRMGIIQGDPISVVRFPSKTRGGLSRMLGITNREAQEPFIAHQISEPQAKSIQSGVHYDQMVELLGNDFEKATYLSFENEIIDGKKALILSDSFFKIGHMRPLLAEHFSRLDALDYRVVTPELVAEAQPDVVILELTERYIFLLSDPNYMAWE